MKKLMLLAVMLAMVVATTVPSLAQSFSADIGGDHDNGCQAGTVINWEGDVENEQGIEQTTSPTEDNSTEGTSLEVSPEQPMDCEQENNTSEVEQG